MKRNLKIVLAVFVLMCLIGIYGKQTYVPIQIPTNDVDLRIEGIIFTTWFTFTFIFNIVLFILLTTITLSLKLFRHLTNGR